MVGYHSNLTLLNLGFLTISLWEHRAYGLLDLAQGIYQNVLDKSQSRHKSRRGSSNLVAGTLLEHWDDLMTLIFETCCCDPYTVLVKDFWLKGLNKLEIGTKTSLVLQGNDLFLAFLAFFIPSKYVISLSFLVSS